MRRVAIVNCYGDANRGSAALNAAAIGAARTIFHECEVGLVAINEFEQLEREEAFRHSLAANRGLQVLAPLLTRASLSLGSLSALPLELMNGHLEGSSYLDSDTANFLSSSDLVISRGGVVYHSRRGSSARLLRRTSAMRYAHLKGIPSMHLGLHVMNVDTYFGRAVVEKDLSQSKILLPRGPISAEWARRIAPRGRAMRTPDSVFSLCAQSFIENQKVNTEHWAISVTHRAETAIDDIVDIVKRGRLEGRVTEVSVVVQVTGKDSDGAISIALAKRLESLVTVNLIDKDLTYHELVGCYSKMGLVIATRLHAGVFGLLGGTPSVILPMGGRAKYMDVFSEIGLGTLVLDQECPEERWARVKWALKEESRDMIRSVVRDAADRHERALDFARKCVTSR